MDRMACVNLPNFPIQILLQQQPGWCNRPAAVVDSDKPQGTILNLNQPARALKVRTGMRFAAGLSLAQELQGAVVSDKEIVETVARVCKALDAHCPRVEPASGEAGVFWLDASGLERLYGSLGNWVEHIRSDLQHIGFDATVVLGFKRFATYALAKAHRGAVILKNPAEELHAVMKVHLDCLALESRTRDLLLKLGIRTVGQFINLPPTGIARRFGPEVQQLHKMARRKIDLPLTPARSNKPLCRRTLLDYPEKNVNRLVVAIEHQLGPIIQFLTQQGRLILELDIQLQFDRIGTHTEKLRPAEPTRDGRLLLDLIRLRLQGLRRLPDGVIEIELTVQCVNAIHRQHHLLDVRPRRDPDSANRALARLRAEFGNEAVVHARLCDAHLPEARFSWEPLHILEPAKPRTVHRGCLIRRINSRPPVLTGWAKPQKMTPEEPQPDLDPKTVARSFGPFMISGGWWRRAVERAYYYAETLTGEIVWIYYDRLRNRWYQQGKVE